MLASASYTIIDIADGLTKFHQYAKNASNTTAPTTGWSAAMPASEAGKFIWSREGYALTYDEVPAWGNSMCLTGATGSKGDTGNTGAPGVPGTDAKSFQIIASPPTFTLSSRGMVVEAKTIVLNCVKANIPEATAITWSASNLTLPSTTGNSVSITIPVGFEAAEISISCTVSGFPVQTLKIMGVKAGDPLPVYLGVLNDSEPNIENHFALAGGKFIEGDFYLYQSGQGNYPKWFDGVSWSAVNESTPNYSQICSAVLGDSLKQSGTPLATSAIYGFFQTLVSNDAFIKKLGAQVIKLLTGGKIESEEYVENISGFQLRSDGTFNAINANLINAVISGSGTFKGILDSPPLKTTTQSEAGTSVPFNPKTHWNQLQFDGWLASTKGFGLNTLYTLAGSYNGTAFDRVIRTSGSAYVQHIAMSGAGQDLLKTNTDESYCIGTERSVTIEVSGYYKVNFTAPQDTWYEEMPNYCPMTVYKNGTPLCMNAPSQYWSSYISADYSFTSWLVFTTFSKTYSHYYSFNRGDVIKYFAPYIVSAEGSETTREGRYTYGTPSVTLDLLISDPGVYLRQNFIYTRLIPNYFYSTMISISGFTASIDYAKAAAFVSGVSSYTVNEMKTASGTFTYNGTPYTVTGVMKTSATSMTLFHTNGTLMFSLPDGDPGTSGYYNASGSYAVVSSVAGAEVMNINARVADTYSIGNTTRFLMINSKNVNAEAITGNVNVAGTGNRVYGAVFN